MVVYGRTVVRAMPNEHAKSYLINEIYEHWTLGRIPTSIYNNEYWNQAHHCIVVADSKVWRCFIIPSGS